MIRQLHHVAEALIKTKFKVIFTTSNLKTDIFYLISDILKISQVFLAKYPPPLIIFTSETINPLLKYDNFKHNPIKHNPIMHNLGETIKKLRKGLRLSQTELAHLLDIPAQSKISSWENGSCIPDVLEAQKLAHIFGVTVAFLLGEG